MLRKCRNNSDNFRRDGALFGQPSQRTLTKRISALVKELGKDVTYPEIGMETGMTLSAVNATTHVGVDFSSCFFRPESPLQRLIPHQHR